MTVFSASVVYATVQPSLETLVSSSDIVLVAFVSKVETKSDKSRIVTIIPLDTLKGKLNPSINEISFHYNFVGKVRIDFPTLWNAKSRRLFFFKKTLDDNAKMPNLELTDAWFGVADPSEETVSKIKQLVKESR